ncbi:MAG: hypothetical protein IV097_02175 [Burkholderiaceae bacterium]|nr:hypothetical protein [Burkholderiaceae bacterium]
MSKFWRIALAWLLAVALPIQGYAATTMLLCGPAHHQSSAAQDHGMHAHGDAAMAHDDAVGHGEAVDATDAAQAGKCSVCSSCCNAAAIMASVVAPAVVSPDLPEVVPVLIAEERVIIGGLERPPRHSRI